MNYTVCGTVQFEQTQNIISYMQSIYAIILPISVVGLSLQRICCNVIDSSASQVTTYLSNNNATNIMFTQNTNPPLPPEEINKQPWFIAVMSIIGILAFGIIIGTVSICAKFDGMMGGRKCCPC